MLDSLVISLSWRYVVVIMSHEFANGRVFIGIAVVEAFRLVVYDWAFLHHYGDVGSDSCVSTTTRDPVMKIEEAYADVCGLASSMSDYKTEVLRV